MHHYVAADLLQLETDQDRLQLRLREYNPCTMNDSSGNKTR